jgi:trk system potassium uptake protein
MPFYFSGTEREAGVRMHLFDCLFEAQSGFSTTGATVISDLESPRQVTHAILFWRSTTQFLGGLGIIVLFVVILGQGSAGKALMRAEMPGPTKEGATPRMQDTALRFAMMYCGLNLVLAVIMWLLGLSMFDALCHAFTTMATGGFSTYNASIAHFDNVVLEYVIVVFMVLAGTNFVLLYHLFCRRPGLVVADVEWRAYMGILAAITAVVVLAGLFKGDFETLPDSLRYGLFQVVSIMTTTGFGTHDFDAWSHFSRGVLFLIMFIGGCAGSTGGGLKVIRHLLFVKILRLEIEHAYRPTVVRPLRLGGRAVEEGELRKNILVYFSLILVIVVVSWVLIIALEPDATWGDHPENKLLDSASSVAATLNNIGPGLGTVGVLRNYGHFTWWSKCLFVWLMMVGRLEIFSILVLFAPGFWRNR